MPNFCANIIFLFNEVEFLERIGLAARCGFKAIECQRPYDIPPDHLNEVMAEAGVGMVLINTPPSMRDPAENGVAAISGHAGEFQELTGQAIDYAAAIGCQNLHVVAGRGGGAAARDTFISNIRWAADMGRDKGVRILIEPLNGTDNPGYFLTTAAQARDILADANHDNLRLQYDLYHAGVNGEDIAAALAEYMPIIGHMQMAGVPGRHEPDTGDIDMPALFGEIERLGYSGWVGAEYRPATATLAGLSWGAPYGISSPAGG